MMLLLTRDAQRPKHFMIIIVMTVALLVLTRGSSRVVFAQSPISAQVDRSSLATNEQLTLRITVTADDFDIPSPDLSDLRDFVVVSSSTSTQVSIINGRMTSQGVFSYRLQPLRGGNLLIPPISAVINGQTYQTEPIRIQVSASGKPSLPSSEDFPAAKAPETLQGQNLFVEAEVDNVAPYLGQQIVYIFRFYQAIDFPINFRGRLDYRAPSFTDFWSQTVLSQPHYTTSAAEREYTVTEVRTALFPAGLNEITIEPARLVVPGGLLTPDVVLETEPITIDVQSLPKGAPEDFNGAVGQFEIKAALSADEGQVNDTLTLAIDIEGAGNIDALSEPELPELPTWRLFDSQPLTTVEPREDRVYGVRRFERLIVPGQPGQYTIPSINFSYYDPEVGAYQVIHTDPLPVTIRPDERDSSAEITSDTQSSDLATGDIRPLKPVPASLEGANFFTVSNVIYWSCWVAPVLIISAVWVLQRQRERLLTDTAYTRRIRARRIAQKILAQARQANVDSYGLAQRALLGYLSDKLNRPTTGLTIENLVDLLNRHQLDPQLIERIKTILYQTETSRFAPIAAEATKSLISDIRHLIKDLEKFFRGKRK